MSETSTDSILLTVQAEVDPILNPTLRVAKDGESIANALANTILAQRLRGYAKNKHKIALSDEECVNLINEHEEEIENIDPDQLDQLFDQLVKQPRATITVKAESSENQPSDSPGLDTALQTQQPPPSALDAAIAATTRDSNSKAFPVLPLRTSRNTLIRFARRYAEEHPFQKNDNIFKKLNMASAIGSGPEWNIFSSNDYIIRNMDFNTYWMLRSSQMEDMQKELNELIELLNIEIDENGNFRDQKGLAKFLHKADQFIRDPFAKTLNEKQKIEYIRQMQEFLNGVRIDVTQNPQEAHIKKKYGDDEIDLVTMTEDTHGELNNMDFRINPELLKDTSIPNREQKLADAIELSIDQATRLLERNQDRNYRLHIEGYKNSPELVLRIFYSAKLHGHNPTIDKATLKAWREKAESGTDAEKERYNKSLTLYEKLNSINRNEVQKLKQHEDEVLAQKLGKHGPIEAGKSSSNALPSITSTKPK